LTKEKKEEIKEVVEVKETSCLSSICGCFCAADLEVKQDGKTKKLAGTVAHAKREVTLAVLLPPWGHHYEIKVMFNYSVSLKAITTFMAQLQRYYQTTCSSGFACVRVCLRVVCNGVVGAVQ
jgi:hypothetical protein